MQRFEVGRLVFKMRFSERSGKVMNKLSSSNVNKVIWFLKKFSKRSHSSIYTLFMAHCFLKRFSVYLFQNVNQKKHSNNVCKVFKWNAFLMFFPKNGCLNIEMFFPKT